MRGVNACGDGQVSDLQVDGCRGGMWRNLAEPDNIIMNQGYQDRITIDCLSIFE